VVEVIHLEPQDSRVLLEALAVVAVEITQVALVAQELLGKEVTAGLVIRGHLLLLLMVEAVAVAHLLLVAMELHPQVVLAALELQALIVVQQ
jgi:hypothetical protein